MSQLQGDRSHPLYRSLFFEGNIGFIDGPDRAEVVQVNTMVMFLKANPGHPMADRATTLETMAATLDSALGTVVSAEFALRRAERMEKEKRDDLRRALRKSAALLRAELMDERLVASLFPSIEKCMVPEDAEETSTVTA